MNWLARLKKTENTPPGEPTKPTKGAFVGFVAPVEGVFPENEVSLKGAEGAANLPDHQADPQHYARAHVPSANLQTPQVSQTDAAQICAPMADELHAARVNLFTRRGLRINDAERLAATIARRLPELDDRRICLECRHLSGNNCSRASYAGAGRVVQAIVRLPQRCPAFEGAV
jgi:hypothetical protein